MEQRFEVENVHCGGCARAIEKALRADARITQVAVDTALGLVVIDATTDVRADAAATLSRIGYPEKKPA
jgi:copper chaperone CopZ